MNLHLYTRAHDCATAAIKALESHGIPPTPEAFTVWYWHTAGTRPELSRVVRKQLASRPKGGKVPDEAWRTLFEQFFSTTEDSSMVVDTTDRLSDTLAQILDLVVKAGGDSARFQEILGDYSARLQNAPDGETVRAIVAGVLEETERVRLRHAEMEAQLRDSSSEVEQLRHHLALVREEALLDPLTAICNRKALESNLDLAIREATEKKTPLCYAMIDIDHFKSFNDNYGHALGDQVLKLVAATLKQSIKGRDTAARYGGEEFAAVLPETALKNAVMLIDRVRQAVASKAITRRSTGEDLGSITLSAGVAQYRPGEDALSLIQRADAALYAAKDKGRNQVLSESAVARLAS